ncbi:MAG: SDR family oxidoreductase [Gammaproteobacteria bacterium]|nr:SDR family oxidoreductase [Gammaproteobacteria bacterium]
MEDPYRRRMPGFALVSGAAGGIGSATARRFAAEGVRVAVTDIDAAKLDALASDIGALALPADGSSREALHEVIEKTVAEFGALDTLIATQGAASAGTVSPKGDKAWAQALDINLTGPYFLAGEALPHLVKRRGSIVLIASTAGLFAGPVGGVGYTAAKSGVVGLARWLARDYGPRGVRVNALCPGWVKTALADNTMAYLAQREGITVEEAYARSTRHIPLRRVSQPAEIAAVCAFLASSDAAMVTGHAMVVDGGGCAVDIATIELDA